MRVRPVLYGVAQLGALALILSHCSAPAVDDSTDSEDPIYGGSVDSDGTNGAVVALRIGTGLTAELCSATAIAPNVLLTARHCVSKNVTKTVVCNAKGESENGPHFGDDQKLEDLHVYTGAKPNFSGPVAAAVKNIVRPDTMAVCNQDIALLVLDRSLPDVTPMPVRLTRSVGVEETIRSVGYGKSDTGTTGTRIRKTGVVVRAVGPGLSKSDTALGDHEFEVGLSICHGDSGGPAISQSTGAIVGVVSRGGDCSEDFGHIYVETSGFSDLIDQALSLAGAPPPLPEPPPSAAPASTSKATPSSEPRSGGCALGARTTSPLWGWDLAIAFGAVFGAALRRRRRAG